MTDFAPPYALRGRGALVIGFWRRPPPSPPLPPRHRWLAVAGCRFGVVIVNDYDPPPAHPVPYREVIVAGFAWRGFRVTAVPLTLVLDEPFFVEVGRRHYQLPKREDPSLRVSVTDAGIVAETAEDALVAVSLPSWAQGLLYPLRALMGASVAWGTRAVPVLGWEGAPPLRAIMALETSLSCAGSRVHRVTRRTGDFARLSPLWAQSWRPLGVRVEAPAPY